MTNGSNCLNILHICIVRRQNALRVTTCFRQTTNLLLCLNLKMYNIILLCKIQWIQATVLIPSLTIHLRLTLTKKANCINQMGILQTLTTYPRMMIIRLVRWLNKNFRVSDNISSIY